MPRELGALKQGYFPGGYFAAGLVIGTVYFEFDGALVTACGDFLAVELAAGIALAIVKPDSHRA